MSVWDKIKKKMKKAFVMGGVATTALTGSADIKESQPEETSPTPITKTQEVKDTSPILEPATGEYKILLNADNQAEWDTMNAMLNDFSKTERGRDLLSRVSPDLKITTNEKDIPQYAGATYAFGKKTINISSDALKNYHQNKNGILAFLSHEALHNIQEKEGRSNSHKTTDGLSAYADFIISKLTEAETSLADAMNHKQFNSNSEKAFAQFYMDLKEKMKQNPNLKGNEQAIERAAKTEYVKTLWESSSSQTEGPQEFKEWATGYNIQAMKNVFRSPTTQSDPQKTKEKIQKFIDAMDVNLTPDYFMDRKHIKTIGPQMEQALKAKEGLDNKEYNQLKTSAGRLAYRHCLKESSEINPFGFTFDEKSNRPRKDLGKLLNGIKVSEKTNLFDNPDLESPLTPELEKEEDAFFKEGQTISYSSSDSEAKIADGFYRQIDNSFGKFQKNKHAQIKSNGRLKSILRSISHSVTKPQSTQMVSPHTLQNPPKQTSSTGVLPIMSQKTGGR